MYGDLIDQLRHQHKVKHGHGIKAVQHVNTRNHAVKTRSPRGLVAGFPSRTGKTDSQFRALSKQRCNTLCKRLVLKVKAVRKNGKGQTERHGVFRNINRVRDNKRLTA
jgi:hypothetical protein